MNDVLVHAQIAVQRDAIRSRITVAETFDQLMLAVVFLSFARNLWITAGMADTVAGISRAIHDRAAQLLAYSHDELSLCRKNSPRRLSIEANIKALGELL